MEIKIAARYPHGACSYYRTYGVIPFLNRLDSSINITALDKVDWSRLSGADVLYIERPQDGDFLGAIKLARQFGVKVWIDYDDDLFCVPHYNPMKMFYDDPKTQTAIKKALEFADVVTVATDPIKETYKEYNDNIHVVPNAFNDYAYSMPDHSSKKGLVAWRGSETHRGDLLNICRQVIELSQDYNKQWEWIFFGNNPWYLTEYMADGCVLATGEKSLTEYMQLLQRQTPSLFFVPLQRNKFNHAKSNCSWLEATFAGSCVVASDLPEFHKPGIENFKTPEEFFEKMEILIDNPAQREKNFQASKEYIKNNLMLSTVNKQRIEILGGLYGS